MKSAATIILLAMLMACNGCATIYLYANQKTEGSPGTEFRGNRNDLKGYHIKNIPIDNVVYARILVDGPRAKCNDNSILEMILPLSSDRQHVPIIGETSANDTTPNLVVIKIDMFDNAAINRALTEETAWKEYPAIIIFNDDFLSQPRVAYRYGPSPSDIQLVNVDMNLKWVCRSRVLYYAEYLLYPFSIAFDIVTFPVQGYWVIGILMMGN